MWIRQIDRLIYHRLTRMEKYMTKEFDDVKAGIFSVRAAVDKAVAAIKVLSDKLAAVDAPAALATAASDLSAIASDLTAALPPA